MGCMKKINKQKTTKIIISPSQFQKSPYPPSVDLQLQPPMRNVALKFFALALVIASSMYVVLWLGWTLSLENQKKNLHEETLPPQEFDTPFRSCSRPLVLLGFSFGIGKNNTPGASNDALADHIAAILKGQTHFDHSGGVNLSDHNKGFLHQAPASPETAQSDPLCLPSREGRQHNLGDEYPTKKAHPTSPWVLVQWEIADALRIRHNLSTTFTAYPRPGHYLSTTGVLEQFIHWLEDTLHQNVAKTPHRDELGRLKGPNMEVIQQLYPQFFPLPTMVVAHRDHYPRASSFVRQRRREQDRTRQFRVLNRREDVPGVYDIHSTQEWTRSYELFAPHERKLGFDV